jgi:oligoendopeptidase F
MFDQLPRNHHEVWDWTWENYQPYVDELLNRELTEASVDAWLRDYTRLYELLYEVYSRLSIMNTQNTADEDIEKRLQSFLENILPRLIQAADSLNRKLVDSGIQPQGFEVPLQKIRAEIELFREANLPLITEEQKLGIEFNKVMSQQAVEVEGETRTVQQAKTLLTDQDRSRREQIWGQIAARQLQDRETLNEIWIKLLDLRVQIAANAGKRDYREYTWQDKKRFDYTPEDCMTFHAAIEKEVVPAAVRLRERRRQALGLPALRPWDVPLEPHDPSVDPRQRHPLKPYQSIEELNSRMAAIFHRVDPQLGGYYDSMIAKDLLDLDSRMNKAPGGYCAGYPIERVPFIFMNAVRAHSDIQTLLHEGGHAFHVFECRHLPYFQQLDYPIEFAEVASMSMELLAAPYLSASQGGYYSDADAARARIEHLEDVLTFWPYMAVVDGFQHWVYTHPNDAKDPLKCDAQWGELWERFIPGVDYSGLDDWKVTGWQRKLHIFRIPFYYVEYGLAALGAVQVYANSLKNHAAAVASYRRALALGGTAPLPKLFETAGAKFAFDADTVKMAVEVVEREIEQLEAIAG